MTWRQKNRERYNQTAREAYRRKGGKPPLTPKQKQQKKEFNRAYYLKNKQAIIDQHREYRKTPKGRELRRGDKKRYKEKYPEKWRAMNRAYAKSPKHIAYQLATREKRTERQKKWYAENHTRELAKKAEQRNDPAYREDARLRSIAWRLSHPGWYVAWCRKNPDKARTIGTKRYNKRRAMKKGASVGTDRKAYKAFIMILRTAERLPCYWCGRITRKGQRHADHIVPLNRQGKDDVHNLCCACPKCNTAKKDKPPEVFSGQFELQFA